MTKAFLHDQFIVARQRFCDLASRLGWDLFTFSLASGQAIELGDESDLADTIDVVVSRADADAATLLVTAGLHGVEGLFGSAAQFAVLNEWGSKLDSMNIRLVLVHTLNPWGFLHGRRVDAMNRDLNRNFLLPGEPYEGSPPLYKDLDPLINPSDWPGVDLFLWKAMRMIARHGRTDLRRAIAAGQYDYPAGLFFGGHQASPQHAFLAHLLPGWVGSSRRVVHVDFHTGLGRWKTWKFLPDGRLADQHQRELTRWFSADAFSGVADQDGGYRTRGGLGQWCSEKLNAGTTDTDYLYVCAEFGTYSGLRILKALRRENHCHQASVAGRMQSESPPWLAAKDELREMFFPSSPDWQQWAIKNASDLIGKFAVSLHHGSRRD